MSKNSKKNTDTKPENEILTVEEQNKEATIEEGQEEKAEAETLENNELDGLKDDLAREKDKFLRLFAEFENYKKRVARERIELFKTAGKEVIVELLPVLDDFDRALNEIGKSKEKELLKGVELIENKLRETLRKKGLLETKTQKGDAFDAEKHQAITQIPAPDKKLKGKIVDVIEKGYLLGDTIIRFPKVVVGQ